MNNKETPPEIPLEKPVLLGEDFYREELKIYAIMLACSIVSDNNGLTLKQQVNIWYPESWLD
tara:strand:- start:1600 stop:1785 length:186 start_codon:yes stop_codon:yes gene_type:complete